MITKRPADQRGHANYAGLDSWISFSFADYHDPQHNGWGPLRVLNDDTVRAGSGFATHGHREMEIISVVLSGSLAHQDNFGNAATIVPGEVQRLSAGDGVQHSEFNPAETASRFLQIWIEPALPGGAPSYQQRRIDEDGSHDGWQVLASADGRAGSVSIRQDATLFRTRLAAGQSRAASIALPRLAYAHVIAGAVSLSGTRKTSAVISLGSGDGVKISDEATLIFTAREDTDLLLFDLPG